MPSLRFHQLFAISVVAVLLSGAVIARDARYKRVDGDAISAWVGVDAVDAILASREHEYYRREEGNMVIARANDDNDDDNADPQTTAATKTADPTRTTDKPETTQTDDDKKTTKAPGTTKTEDADATKTTSKVRVTVSTEANGDVTTVDLPTLYPGGITALPKAQIPPTSDAPYRQTSKYPEGFIFILVGSIIGFAFACVLLWRAIIAWSINRSVRRTTGTKPTGSSGMGDNETDPMMLPFGRRGSTSKGPGVETRAKRRRRRSSHSNDIGTAYTDVPMTKGPMVESRWRPEPEIAPITVGHNRPNSHHTMRNSSALYFSPTANPGAINEIGHRRQRSGGYLPAGYYPTAPRSNPPHSRHASRTQSQLPLQVPPSPGKRSTGTGRRSRRSSMSQGQASATPPLPLSTQHLHSLDMMSQEQQQQQHSPQQTPPHHLSHQVRYQSSDVLPPPLFSNAQSGPVRGPSMLLDDLLGSGVSIDGSVPDARGYANDGSNENNGKRAGRNRKDSRR